MIKVTSMDVGRAVVYRAFPMSDIPQLGRISSVRENPDGSVSVWVRYQYNCTGELTPVDRLEWA